MRQLPGHFLNGDLIGLDSFRLALHVAGLPFSAKAARRSSRSQTLSRLAARPSGRKARWPIALLTAALLLAGCAGPIVPPPLPTATADTAAPSPVNPTGETPPPSAPPAEATASPTPDVPVAVSVNLGAAPQTLDPVSVAPLDASANDLVENLFAGLGYLNPATGRVEPSLAASWEPSDGGRTWRVTLRDDVQWVRVDPATGAVIAVRPIEPHDVVAAAERACRNGAGAALGRDPALFIISGCRDLYETPDSAPDDAPGVRALDDTTVEFELTAESGLFPTLLALPALRPVPADLVTEAGDAWTQPASIQTSGPYALLPAAREDGGVTLVANPFWPLPRAGNVDRVEVTFGGGADALHAWQAGDLALAAVPGETLSGAASTAPASPMLGDPAVRVLALPAADLMSAQYDVPPMDNPGVRRALSLSLDRETIARMLTVMGQPSLPAAAITPPGAALAPSYGAAGAGYDPDAALRTLADAGYRDCQLMPPVEIVIPEGDARAEQIVDLAIAGWSETLGCRDRFSIRRRPLIEVLARFEDIPTNSYQIPRPGLIIFSWLGDTPDAQHWQADLLGCRELFPGSFLNQDRACVDAESDLSDALSLTDQDARAAVYAEVAAAFFGPAGEMPAIPVTYHARALVVQPWLEIPPQDGGPLRFDGWLAHSP
jgi:ABC-type transport system substrate-binding protein